MSTDNRSWREYLPPGIPDGVIIALARRNENRAMDVFWGFFPTTLDGDG
jgi:hypothetical protein